MRGHGIPKYLSSDHDPLYRFHQWQANLRVLDETEIKTTPYVPLSHPFVERLIGTIRREFLDRTLFWTTADLEAKLADFQHYYNAHRTHGGLGGRLPQPGATEMLRSWNRGRRNLTADYLAAIATPNRPAMNAACPRMSFFGNHRICPLRIMFTVSIP